MNTGEIPNLGDVVWGRHYRWPCKKLFLGWILKYQWIIPSKETPVVSGLLGALLQARLPPCGALWAAPDPRGLLLRPSQPHISLWAVPSQWLSTASSVALAPFSHMQDSWNEQDVLKAPTQVWGRHPQSFAAVWATPCPILSSPLFFLKRHLYAVIWRFSILPVSY